MTILCEPDAQAAAAVLPALGGQARAVATMGEVAMTIAQDASERLVVVGPDVPFEQVASFTRELHAHRPDVAVLVVRHTVDDQLLRAAADAGILEVVPAADGGALVTAHANAVAALETSGDDGPTEDEEPDQGQIVTVFAAKGGCGKTTMATNIAVALNDGGNRKVCLVDLDLDFGDVAITMRLTPVRTLVDAITETPALRRDPADRLDALLTNYGPDLDCVLAPVEPGEADKIPATVAAEVLTALRDRYEYVVIDTPAHFTEHVLAALDVTDQFVLVTTPEIPSLKNLRLTLDMFDLLGYPRERRHILFNRSDDQTGLTADDIESAVKSPIDGHVPSSRDVPISINRGVPLVAAQPQHAVSTAVRQFVQRCIVGQQQQITEERRLFGRRKSLRK